MTDKKPKSKRYVTPRGVAIWPRLNAPDTKFDADGVYSVKLAFEGDDADALAMRQSLIEFRDAEFKKYVSENPKVKKVAKVVDFFTDETDDEGEETGRWLMNFKQKAKITSKKTGKTYKMKPTIVNAAKAVLNNPPNIGGGSVLKVSFEVFTYFNAKDKEFGLSLRLVAVQIITLVEFGGNAANDFDEEDGWAGGDREDADGDSSDDSDDDDQDDDGGDGDY